MKSSSRTVLALSSAALFCGIASFGMAGKSAAAPMHASKISYKSIEPLIKDKCVKCHNDKRAADGVNLASYRALMASKVVTPGHPEKSKLYTYVDGEKKPQMPLRAPALTSKEVMRIKMWIKSGASK